MEIRQLNITIREVFEKYFNDTTYGVIGYNGLLEIRPSYQREFLYGDAERDEVVRSVLQGFPIGIMYWCKVKRYNGNEGYDMIDGQQRTISVCDYISGKFAVDGRYFKDLELEEKKAFVNYPLSVYICDGTPAEKLNWFKIINTSGNKLSMQEMRNAAHVGTWLADAKRCFSKNECEAYFKARDYVDGIPVNQDYLECALLWAADAEGLSIDEYMDRHYLELTAVDLFRHFCSVIDWVKTVFPSYREEMKGLPWGIWFNRYGERTDLDPIRLEAEVERLMKDASVTGKAGIYEYLLTGDKSKLTASK